MFGDVFGNIFKEEGDTLFNALKEIEVLKIKAKAFDHLSDILKVSFKMVDNNCYEFTAKAKKGMMFVDFESNVLEIIETVKNANTGDVETLKRTKEELAKKLRSLS